ncbi:MAG: ABC transporter permease [Phycisphaerales bacterium]
MNKILTIAWREFVAVVATKGFILGMILPPLLVTMVITVIPVLINKKPPAVAGHIAIIDRTGTNAVSERLKDAFTADKLKERRDAQIQSGVQQGIEHLSVDPAIAKQAQDQLKNNPAAAMAMPDVPNLRVQILPPDTDVEAAKQEILNATGRETDAEADKRLVLVVVPKGSVEAPATADPPPPGDTARKSAYEPFQLFVAPRLDPEVQEDIRDQAAKAIVDTRLATARLDVDRVRALMERPQSESKAVTKEGDRSSNEVAKMLVPGAFMILLWISVFTAGQHLMTSTIEEKSNRIMEVLLSATSPMELMMGKVLGKGAVGLLILIVYTGVGGSVLVALAMSHILEWQNLVYLFIYFLIAYFTIASLFSAVGAAVNEIAEAQSLMAPIMLVLVIPMMLWMPILRNPNSTFAQVCSFVPLINPFVMVLRISGSEPVPLWQIPASIVVGVLTVLVLVWAAAKVFRIGVLMYGKPPNFATLIRWVRMA